MIPKKYMHILNTVFSVSFRSFSVSLWSFSVFIATDDTLVAKGLTLCCAAPACLPSMLQRLHVDIFSLKWD